MLFAKKGKLKVVADTNIYIRALHFGGDAEVFLALAASRTFQLYVSKYILWELRMVLMKKFGWSRASIKDAENSIREIAVVINPQHTIAVIQRDKADNRILECALAAKAHYLVTEDRAHLHPLKIFRNIRIVDLREFLSAFRP